MKIKKNHTRLFLLTGLLLLNMNVFSQDPNFYIYLCFGQSNMEGQGTIEPQDNTVDSRFQVMEALDCSNLARKKGSWYTATPPLCRCYTGLSPVDYFGKTMVANLPDSIRVGVINVSVAGCKIELYDKDNYQTYTATVESWMKNMINEYGGNPYGRLVEMAKLAQKDGVIKGFLLHQGESNTGDNQWSKKVKGVYDNLIKDLELADSVPLLAGEVVHADQGGVCAGANSMIATLPKNITNSYVISSSKCTDASDNLHFNSVGYREIGKRYAIKMLSILGVASTAESFWFEAECAAGDSFNITKDAKASNGYCTNVKAGLQSTSEVYADSAGFINIPFSVTKDTTYYIYARLNCATADDDSYWIKIDTGKFAIIDGLTTSGWQWLKLDSCALKAGSHTLTISYCEDGANLDKLCITNYKRTITGVGDPAQNLCVITTPPVVDVDVTEAVDGFALSNYPNPFSDITTITFEIPNDNYVSLKVYNVFGNEIVELAGKEYSSRKHTVEFNAQGLPKGVYFYRMKAGKYYLSQKMMLQGK